MLSWKDVIVTVDNICTLKPDKILKSCQSVCLLKNSSGGKGLVEDAGLSE